VGVGGCHEWNDEWIPYGSGKREEVSRRTKDRWSCYGGSLLGAWKELIIGEMVKLLQATNDPKILQLADENIALAQGATRLKFGVIAGGKRWAKELGACFAEFSLRRGFPSAVYLVGSFLLT
jgi:hypothetical protein